MGRFRIAVSLFLCAFAAFAQETRSTINGRVYDQSSAAIARAEVLVTSVDTNTTVKLTSNDTGYYEAPLLIPGAYRIAVKAEGFKAEIRDGISLQVSQTLSIDFKLALGSVSETVRVTAEAPVLETNSLEAGALVNNKDVMELPVQGNNPTLFVKLMPGVQTDGVNKDVGLHSIQGGSTYNNAAKVGGNEWSVDGTPNNGGDRQAAYLPYSDAVAEFRVDPIGMDASQGRGTGMTIAAMTKAGTNQYHGTLTELHWQQRYNGTPYFTRKLYLRSIADAEAKGDTALADRLRRTERQPSGHSNQYAVTIGGPVIVPKLFDGRNKLFTFFAFNGFNDRKTESASSFNKTVPTMANRQGDFSSMLRINAQAYQIYDPLSVRRDPARSGHWIRTPMAGNIVPKSRILAPKLYDFYSKLYPVPNNDPLDPRQEPLNNYIAWATPWILDYRAFQNRIDYNHSQAHRFFARWSWNNFQEDNYWTYETIPGMTTGGLTRKNMGAMVDWTWMIRTTTLLDVSAAANEFTTGNRKPVPMSYKPTDLGLPKYLDDFAGDQHILPLATVSGYTSAAPTGVPSFTRYRIYTPQVKLSHYRGKHSINGGVDSRYHFRTGGGGGNTSGNFAFDNRFTKAADDNFIAPASIGLSWAAFMMGLPYQSSIAASSASYATFSPYYGGFLQDQWRLTRKLSVTLGMRLEWEGGQTERYNRWLGYFDKTVKNFVSDVAEASYKNRPMGALDSNIFGHAVTGRDPAAFAVRGGTSVPGRNAPRQLWQNQWMFMPRIAFAYSLNQKTVIRGGAGTFFDTLNVTTGAPNQTGFNRTTTVSTYSNYGSTWLVGDPANGISPLADPFPANRYGGSRFDSSTDGSLGYDTYTGRSYSFNDWDTKRAHQYRWRLGLQRQIGRHSVLGATYTGTYSSDVYVTVDLNPVPGEYYWHGNVRNTTLASYMNGGISNPFNLNNFPGLATSNPLLYSDMTSQSFFNNSTVSRAQLLKPFPAMTGLSQTNSPRGRVRTNGVEVTFNRRFVSGFNWNFFFTGTKARTADWFPNPYDRAPAWRESNNSRPYRVTSTGIYQFPFGRRRRFFNNTGIVSRLIGGMQVAGTFEYQPGPLLDFGNLYYYGDLDNIRIDNPTMERAFNTTGTACGGTGHGAANSGFERCLTNAPDSYQARVFPTRITGLRAPHTLQVNGNVQKEIPIYAERMKLVLRFDMLNVFNRSQLAGANTTPTNTNFGTITSQTSAINRFLQFQGRIVF